MADVPGPVLLPALEGLRDEVDTYQSLKALQDSQNAQMAYVNSVFNFGDPPAGPKAASVASLGGPVQVTWSSESARTTTDAYVIWRADGGTRSAPTGPVFSAATRVQVLPSQNAVCLADGSGYRWFDTNFTITERDPANPAIKAYWVQTISQLAGGGFVESNPTPAGSIEVGTIGPGDVSPEPKAVPFTKLGNAGLVSSATTADLMIPQQIQITGATNASPIVVSTFSAHGLATGAFVTQNNNFGNTAANGYFSITVVDPTHYSLDGSTGNGVWTGGARAFPNVGQPQPPGSKNGRFEYGWSPWFADVSGASFFASDGITQTYEARMSPTQGGTAYLSQVINGVKFKAGQHLAMSVYARMPTPANGQMVLRLGCNASVTPPASFVHEFSSTLITSVYQRFTFNFALPSNASTSSGELLLFFTVICASGTPRTVFLTRPMLNVGDEAAPWSSVVDPDDNPGNATFVTVDPTTPTWARPVQQIIFRDPSVTFS